MAEKTYYDWLFGETEEEKELLFQLNRKGPTRASPAEELADLAMCK
jgi:hypothetical protein